MEAERYKKMETKMDAKRRIYIGNLVFQMSIFQNYRIFLRQQKVLIFFTIFFADILNFDFNNNTEFCLVVLNMQLSSEKNIILFILKG